MTGPQSNDDDIKKGTEGNSKYCSLCYCYVCDGPASECKAWSSTENPKGFTVNHCNASDKGLTSSVWKSMRDKVKRGETLVESQCIPTFSSYRGYDDDTDFDDGEEEPDEDDSSSSGLHGFLNRMGLWSGKEDDDEISYVAPSPPDYKSYKSLCEQRKCRHGTTPSQELFGPFNPEDDPAIRNDKLLTECRHCGWFNHFKHNNFTRKESYSERHVDKEGNRTWKTKWRKVMNDTGVIDWCKACGRVSSEKDLEKTQSTPHTPSIGDIKLGTKTIPFRIKSRDPRKIVPYKEYWEKFGSSWVYNESDMDEDFFRHRIGKHPTLPMILGAIPVLTEDKIPDESTVNFKSDWNSSYNRANSKPLVSETEALLLSGQNDRVLFEELNQFTSSSSTSDESFLHFTLEGKWDKDSKIGVSSD